MVDPMELFQAWESGIKETVVLRFLCGHSTQLQLAYVSELNSRGTSVHHLLG